MKGKPIGCFPLKGKLIIICHTFRGVTLRTHGIHNSRLRMRTNHVFRGESLFPCDSKVLGLFEGKPIPFDHPPAGVEQL